MTSVGVCAKRHRKITKHLHQIISSKVCVAKKDIRHGYLSITYILIVYIKPIGYRTYPTTLYVCRWQPCLDTRMSLLLSLPCFVSILSK